MDETITLEGLIEDLKENEFERGVRSGEVRELKRIRDYIIKCNQYPTCFHLKSTEFNLTLETHNFVDNKCTNCGEDNNPF